SRSTTRATTRSTTCATTRTTTRTTRVYRSASEAGELGLKADIASGRRSRRVARRAGHALGGAARARQRRLSALRADQLGAQEVANGLTIEREPLCNLLHTADSLSRWSGALMAPLAARANTALTPIEG